MELDLKKLKEVVVEITGSEAIADYAASAIENGLKLRQALIQETTSQRMLQHQAQGRRMSKLPPYGWTEDPQNPKRLIHDPYEQTVVKRIMELHNEGQGFRPICRILADEGYKPHKNTKAGTKRTFSHVTIRAVVRRELQARK